MLLFEFVPEFAVKVGLILWPSVVEFAVKVEPAFVFDESVLLSPSILTVIMCTWRVCLDWLNNFSRSR